MCRGYLVLTQKLKRKGVEIRQNMNQEIARIVKPLTKNFSGKGWFGNNLYQQLEGITAEKATIIPHKLNHSIAEIIAHMMVWRLFVILKINENTEYEVWETDLDWMKIHQLSESNWQNLLI